MYILSYFPIPFSLIIWSCLASILQQLIRYSLTFDIFTVRKSLNFTDDAAISPAAERQDAERCDVTYGDVIDKAARKNISICRRSEQDGGLSRVYVSQSNLLHIVFTPAASPQHQQQPNFIIHVEGTTMKYGFSWAYLGGQVFTPGPLWSWEKSYRYLTWKNSKIWRLLKCTRVPPFQISKYASVLLVVTVMINSKCSRFLVLAGPGRIRRMPRSCILGKHLFTTSANEQIHLWMLKWRH